MRLVLIVVIALLLSLFPVSQQTAGADIVFKNGNVYTVDPKAPRAQAIAVTKDRIVFVGSNADAQKFVGAKTRVVDLKGGTVLPGFADAHQHLSGVGFREKIGRHTSELQSQSNLVCRLLLEKKKKKKTEIY